MKVTSSRNVRHALLGLSCVMALSAAPALAQQQPATPRSAVGAVAPTGQQAFATPQAAFDAFVDAIRRSDTGLMQKLLGARYRELIPADADDAGDLRKKFLDGYAASHKINTDGNAKAILEVGTSGWTMPIPLVKRGDGWLFDVAAGAKEIGNRQIGRHELAVIQVLLAIVDAEQEYAEADPTGTGAGQYARRLLSSPGKKDGLYWPSKPGEPESPLGALIAQAQAKGATQQTGYHGYHYRLLYAQGASAAGGARDYVVNGRMIGGFAVIAWPVTYGTTGNMTFMVSHDGAVFEKDLGPNTEAAAGQVNSFNPDNSWKKSDTSP